MPNQLQRAFEALDPEALDAALSALENNNQNEDNTPSNSEDVTADIAATKVVSADVPSIEELQNTVSDLTSKLTKQNEQMGRMVALLGARVGGNIPTSQVAEDMKSLKPSTVDDTQNVVPKATIENAPNLGSIIVDF